MLLDIDVIFPPHAALEEEKANESAKGLFQTDKKQSRIPIPLWWTPPGGDSHQLSICFYP